MSLANELETHLKSKPALIAGSGGVFDVEVDGKVIFSKHKTGRFPDPGEVLDLIPKK